LDLWNLKINIKYQYQQGAEENIWTKEAWNEGRVEKAA
jgi:hypothetical protein